MSRKRLDLLEADFGSLRVLGYAGQAKGHSYWLCLCKCGKALFAKGSALKCGNTQSCGCSRDAGCNLRHGYTDSPTYNVWRNMKQRCYNPKATDYYLYGGRGITVCDRWLNSFENFLADMGEKPENMSIDRKDNDQHYCKDNCRWATDHEQALNRRAKAVPEKRNAKGQFLPSA
jgi:hypothetical protein